MSEDKPSVSAAPTPETDDLVKKFDACDYLFVNHAKRLERERDDARRGFERMSDTCFAAIRRAEAAEGERDEAIKLMASANLDRSVFLVQRDADRAELAPLPSGYCVAPLEPTDKMAQAAWDIQTSFNPQAIKLMYRAMIKARVVK